jgi:hypothetical protein
MMPMSHGAFSETLDHAFRAALLLSGSAELAEEAVSRGIGGLDFSDAVEKVLVAKTVEFVIKRSDYPYRLQHALALLPHELRWLIHLAPVSRDCFLLRVLCRIPAASCAAILDLTIEEFEESLCDALWRSGVLGRSDLLAESDTSPKGAQK